MCVGDVSRVRLSKRRSKATKSAMNSKLVVRHREMNEDEIYAQVYRYTCVCDCIIDCACLGQKWIIVVTRFAFLVMLANTVLSAPISPH